MKHHRLFLAATTAALSLTSCLQNETTIHLNKDGSGTLVEQTILGPQMMAMMNKMALSLGGDAAKKDPVAEMFSPDKAKARAATLGQGVTLQKNEAYNEKGRRGGRATYHFDDINKLTIAPSDCMRDLSPVPGKAPSSKAPIVFNYTAGALTIAMPEQPSVDEKAAVSKEAPVEKKTPTEKEIGIMKQMMGDMKITMKIVVEPGISETNATYRDGNTITFMDWEVGKLFESPDAIKKLGEVDPKDSAAAMNLMKGIPGIKFEQQKVVTVKLD